MEELNENVIWRMGKYPAFPIDENATGLTMFGYFMAHAPAEIPQWFKTSLPYDKVPTVPGYQDESEEMKKFIREKEYDRAAAEHRYFQWRQYYALRMIQLTIK